MRRSPLLLALLIVSVLWGLCPLKLGVVLGSSMAPSLNNHQLILINRDYYRDHRPQAGDVIVLSHDNDVLVKRIAATGGARLWEIRDPSVGSSLLVRQTELWRIRRTIRRAPSLGYLREVVIPKGYVYVLGDAAQSSYDSRSFGPVPVARIQGRVVAAPRL